MMKVATPLDLEIYDFPPRGDIAAWIPDGYEESLLPSRICSNCYFEAHLPSDCSPYCKNCGSMMINHAAVRHIMDVAFDAYHAGEGKKNDVQGD